VHEPAPLPEASEHYRWDSPLTWFGPTLGCSLWIGISGLVLLARGSEAEGLILAGTFLAILMLSIGFWRQRRKVSAYAGWQIWLAFLWLGSLAAVAVLQWSQTYPKVNLDAWGMVLMWVGVGVGIPLLMLDFLARHKSHGQRGVFGTVFDLLAGFF
jgi:hypothetical protein